MPTEVSPEQKFLRKSHIFSSKNLYNSKWIPEEIWYACNRELRKNEMVMLWEAYLKMKFQILVSLEKTTDLTSEEFTNQLVERSSSNFYLQEFIEDWTNKKESEILGYLYRYSQLPEDQVLNRYYKNNIDSCHEWCDLRKNQIEYLKSQACNHEESWKTNLVKSYSTIEGEPLLNFYKDYSLALNCKLGLNDSIEKVKKSQESLIEASKTLKDLYPMTDQHETILKEIQNIINSILFEYGGDPSDYFKVEKGNFIADLSINLVQVLAEQYDEQALIETFLFALKKRYNCEVCDYVTVEDEDDLIVWRTATVNPEDLSEKLQKIPSEEARAIVRKRESYRKGEGISGEIFLQNSDLQWNLWHHVGSNDVLNDPRQSEDHRHAYEADIYPGVLKVDGVINNFWMFPIFSNGELIAAFRVVNKLDSPDRLQIGGWPYFARVELSLIANWFSKFLESIKSLSLRKEDFLAFLTYGREVDKLSEILDLSWIDRKSLLAILRTFRRLIFKKEENRVVGCSVLITQQQNKHDLLAHQLENYPLLDLDKGGIPYPYDELVSMADIIDPLMGTFVFDKEGYFHRVVSHRSMQEENDISEYNVVQAIGSKIQQPNLLISLPRRARNIILYKNGIRSGELYLAERTGDWKSRFVEQIKDTIYENTEITDTKTLQIVLESILEASQRRFGALIILGDLPREKFVVKPIYRLFTPFTNLSEIGFPYFLEFIKLDGATVIDNIGQVTYVNTMISPLHKVGALEIFPDRGGRHKTAEEVCRLEPNALVIVVSENGGISILKNKKLLKDF